MHPDLFITIAFVLLVVGVAIPGFFVALHERRSDAAAAQQDAARRQPRTGS